ncbi:hypothetical protein [uncultured Stenotrophomonas sp.]|uniref:hypothetical protein n=1 Tax=uncultured Stenotrophomonas sp. TaxID=165438 RepID=UPI0025EAB8DC|nr:hypothetical protein [uncultured Stenotrophomonas sp.]
MNVFDSGLVRLAAGFAVLGGVVAAGIQVNRNLAQLPVEQAAVVSAAAPVPAPKQLYTVAVDVPVKHSRKASHSEVDADLEVAFKGAALQQEADAVPDYAEMARSAIRIDGVTDGGIIIGGRFYAVGSTVALTAANTEAGPLALRLISARPERLAFDVNGQGLILQRGEGGWH